MFARLSINSRVDLTGLAGVKASSMFLRLLLIDGLPAPKGSVDCQGCGDEVRRRSHDSVSVAVDGAERTSIWPRSVPLRGSPSRLRQAARSSRDALP